MTFQRIRFFFGLVKAGKLRCRSQFAATFLPNYRCLYKTAWLSACTAQPTERNVILMGPPGAGKTTVGRLLGKRLHMPVIDIDDHVLENAWLMPVAKKLSQVGGDRFLEEEGEAVCNFHASGSVISLTGSNPLHTAAMQHLKKNGLVVYLDVDTDDIIQRLARMKVNRIVGQEAGTPMEDILMYRKQFYERWFDTKVLCGVEDDAEEVTEKVVASLRRYQDSDSETFVSTRSSVSGLGDKSEDEPKFFSDVVVEGLAPDGGLYVPKGGFPKLSPKQWQRLAKMPYCDRACAILEQCIHPTDVSPLDLRRMVQRAYGANFSSEAIAPVRHLERNQYVLELFHGPTASFKDLALQLMPQLFAHCLPQMCNYLVLVATSGDTGSAVLSGFGGLDEAARSRVGVLVFFPEHGVSQIQKLQMTSIGKGNNARAVSVLSDFDFCQRSIKTMFGDAAMTGHLAVEYAAVLSTANSINWARLLPQVVYHASAYLDLLRDGVLGQFGDPVDVCIPTGNFGNAMSALYAKDMGVPIRRVICASNLNCVVADFVRTGRYDLRGRTLMTSHSPAIDILKSSNLERFLHRASGGDGDLVRHLFTSLEEQQHFQVSPELLQKVNQDVQAAWCSEEDCLATIREVQSRTGYIMDTHTAVAKSVADRLQEEDSSTVPLVICSTAHYGKFAPAVLTALGEHGESVPADPQEQLQRFSSTGAVPEMHGALFQCLKESRSQPHRVCQADFHVLTEEVEATIQGSFLNVQ
ncbi:threonine synthase-like 1 [Engraulis encrasicolus]|uniref:threonine synthase-like 1 n=1 Tax=Engraulis encrasicolus TaxID=184585 RepID=UPI002FD22C11